jgi:hypothetical protein
MIFHSGSNGAPRSSRQHLASESLCYALTVTGKDFNARRK